MKDKSKKSTYSTTFGVDPKIALKLPKVRTSKIIIRTIRKILESPI